MGWYIIGFLFFFAVIIGNLIYIGGKIDEYEEKEAREKLGQDIWTKK